MATFSERVHHADRFLVGVTAVWVSTNIATHFSDVLADVLWPVYPWLALLYIATLLMTVLHVPMECRHCQNRFPPDDAAMAAEVTYARNLRAWHSFYEITLKVMTVVVWPLWWLLSKLPPRQRGPVPVSRWMMFGWVIPLVAVSLLVPAPFGSMMMTITAVWFTLRVSKMHMLLIRWCPQCRDFNDDEARTGPVPEERSHG